MAGFVTYLRVSTKRQGASGLGLEAQRAAVSTFGTPIAELVEVESGANNARPQLAAALRLCRLHRATLLIAKLDRLSRNAAFLLGLKESGVDFVAADMPDANRLTVGIMAVVAESEREMISARTKAALGAAKARGVVLGGYRGGEGHKAATAASVVTRKESADGRAADIAGVISEVRRAGIDSLAGLARALTERAIPKARGGVAWTATDVRNVLARS